MAECLDFIETVARRFIAAILFLHTQFSGPNLPAVKIAAPFLMFMAVAYPASAAVLLVNSGQSIQAAINLAKNGDTIQVGPGAYKERLTFNGKEIELRSSSGAGKTIIDGGGNGTTVDIGGKATIAGFTITGGANPFGGGMAVSGVGTRILNNVFSGNLQGSGGFGAAIAGNNASPLIEGNFFTGNSSDSQHLSGVVSFVNGSVPVIQNNIFYNNDSRALNLTVTSNGPEGTTTASILITNNTFVGNRAAMRVSTSDLTLQNNIIAGNETGFEAGFSFLGTSFANWTNNLLFGNDLNFDGIASQIGVGGNFESDPLFKDVEDENFTLFPNSPAIDAGTALKSPSADFMGNPRPLDGNGDGITHVDIGAFEYVPIPEPSGLLFVGGVAALSLARRRRMS